MYHKTIIVGTVGRDAELRQAGGKSVADFSVAVKDYDDKTVWYKVTVWGKTAEFASQNVKKKCKVFCEGTLNSDENGNPRIWTTNEGQPRSSFELTVFNLKLLTWPEKNETSNSPELSLDDIMNDSNIDSISNDEIPF